MKVIIYLKAIIKRIPWLRILARNFLYGIHRIKYIFNGLFIKDIFNLIVFSSYNGKSYACSPKAVYEYMINDDRFSEYKFIWIFDNPNKHNRLEKNKNTKIVRNGSKACEKYLHLAKYWIFNFRAPDYWVPKQNQVYVQCWHGTPLKRLGYDIFNSSNAMNSVKEIKNKYKVDAKRFSYILSSCRFTTESFISAWNLTTLGKSNAVLEIGYPRNDFLKKYTNKDVSFIKKTLGLENCNKKIILFAPTWRDNQYDAEKGYIYKDVINFDFLKKNLEAEYIILFRTHYFIENSFDFDKYKGFIYDVSKYDDINELYIISDLLITDYSSAFFDYAILEKPMLFFMYDMEEYRDEIRGFYFDINELPGLIVRTEKELVEEIVNFDYMKKDWNQIIKRFNVKYNRSNDGKASERIANIIIDNDKQATC